MIDTEHVRRLSVARGLYIPDADFAALAAGLTEQLNQIRSLERLDLRGVVAAPAFDVRWDR